ncbi:MAG: diguanylate cyclase [Deltaproteobacteria bacterium]|nr:diguanylate cyclase [Deltaproteobacteria bacterium]
MKILIAEDEPTTRALLGRTLERWGHEVVSARDGEEAWEALGVHSDLRILVTDWEMPRLDGPALCERLRASPKAQYVYVIMLTSHRDPLHTVQGLDAGADDYVCKPFNPAELRARIGVGRRLVSLQDELAVKHRELEVANAELRRLASTDPLMQIGNRRSFDDALLRRHALATVDGRNYGVLMVDIDHFKSFNDRFGHAFGDQVLTAVAAAAGQALGREAELYRYGGEEIVGMAPDIDRDRLQVLGERLREAIGSLRLFAPGFDSPAGVTCSVGIAAWDGAEDLTAQALLERADAALYHAKRAGRNRVERWPMENPLAPLAPKLSITPQAPLVTG